MTKNIASCHLGVYWLGFEVSQPSAKYQRLLGSVPPKLYKNVLDGYVKGLLDRFGLASDKLYFEVEERYFVLMFQQSINDKTIVSIHFLPPHTYFFIVHFYFYFMTRG